MNRKEEVSQAIRKLPRHFQYYWCESKACMCMGCVNRNSDTRDIKLTHEEWEEWKIDHPKNKK